MVGIGWEGGGGVETFPCWHFPSNVCTRLIVRVSGYMTTEKQVPPLIELVKLSVTVYFSRPLLVLFSSSNVSRAYSIQYDGSTTEFNVSSSAVRCLPVGNGLRMSNCVIINIYVARRKQYHRLLLSHLRPFNGIIFCAQESSLFSEYFCQ